LPDPGGLRSDSQDPFVAASHLGPTIPQPRRRRHRRSGHAAGVGSVSVFMGCHRRPTAASPFDPV